MRSGRIVKPKHLTTRIRAWIENRKLAILDEEIDNDNDKTWLHLVLSRLRIRYWRTESPEKKAARIAKTVKSRKSWSQERKD